MHSLRTGILHHPWLTGLAVFALLVQMQQSIACEMMIDVSAPPVEHCYKHDAGGKPEDKSLHACCDFSDGFLLQSGHCHDGHDAVNNNSGKLNPDVQLLVVTVSILEISPLFSSTAVQFSPASNPLLPGSRTYLSTQRLRI